MDLRPGKYRHYKGNLYFVTGTAIHSETLEEMVIYKMLYTSDKYPEGTLWIRPKKMFLEMVDVGGKLIPRFEFVGE